MAERGLLGLVRIDEGLVARERYGPLVDGVPLGEPVCSSMLALIGVEDDIRALRDNGGSFRLANMAVRSGGNEPPRVNLNITWDGSSGSYLLILSRVSIRDDRLTEMRQSARIRQLMETELLAKSAEISRTNADLMRANRDLDQFASIISHDLKAPLRALRFVARQLAEEIGDAVGDSVLDKLAAIHEQSGRMNAMLSDLLAYSRIGRKSEAMADVDTGKLVQRIVTSFGLPKSMRVDIAGHWPVTRTLEAPLDLVLRNLIDNAIKHHDKKRLRIKVTAADAGETCRFEVADDGPGIDPSYHEAIFEPFRKVEQEAKPESSGMGLALVKRTLEHLGGEIRIESDPGRRRGTSFHILWPKTPQPPNP